MARTRWPSDPVNPGLCQDRADQTRSAGGCQELGPGRQAGSRTTSTASARSQVRPGPRPRHYARTTARSPEVRRRVGTASLTLPADYALVAEDTFAAVDQRRIPVPFLRAVSLLQVSSCAAVLLWLPRPTGRRGSRSAESQGRGQGRNMSRACRTACVSTRLACPAMDALSFCAPGPA